MPKGKKSKLPDRLEHPELQRRTFLPELVLREGTLKKIEKTGWEHYLEIVTKGRFKAVLNELKRRRSNRERRFSKLNSVLKEEGLHAIERAQAIVGFGIVSIGAFNAEYLAPFVNLLSKKIDEKSFVKEVKRVNERFFLCRTPEELAEEAAVFVAGAPGISDVLAQLFGAPSPEDLLTQILRKNRDLIWPRKK